MSISTNNNLPTPLSAFIGRGRETEDVQRLLSENRLVMLTGAGGSGKTRLSLKVAGELSGEFEHGTWFVELASISDSALVPETVASTLNIREQPGQSLIDTLTNHLSQLDILLVIDNCEHLVSACAQFVETILQKCPNLKILATSREPLGITGEIVWAVPPLSLPMQQPWTNPASAQDALRLYADSDAVQLFVTRAKANSPEFQLTAENGAWVAEICRRLDGMPLALELAAARVRSLTVQQIAQRLNDRFHLLTGGSRTAPLRQQTLESAIDWSYILLSLAEQKVLQRLSVFAGGATMEAAETVCAGDGVELVDVLNVLSHLVDKSLVTATNPERGEMRYRLLETIRQYANRKLAESAEVNESKNRHLDYFVRWAEIAEPSLNGADQLIWLQRFEMENDNLRAAMEWSLLVANRADKGLRLAAITAIFWKFHGHHNEGRLRLAAILEHEAAQLPTLVRAQALHRACVLAFYQSDYSAARALAEESLIISKKHGSEGHLEVADALEMLAEVASETGDYSTAAKLYEEALPFYQEVGYLVGISDTLKMMSWTAMRAGNYQQAESRMEEALVISRQSTSQHSIASSLSALGELALRQGRYDRAQSLLQESLSSSLRLGEKWGTAIALGSLGWLALRQHDFNEMRKLLGESLSIRIESGDRGGMAWCLEKLAEANSLQFRFQPAVIIFGAAAALRAPVGSMMDAVDRPDYERIISSLRTSLGKEAFALAWNEGQAMILEQVIEYALAEPAAAEIEVTLREKFGGLTERERETAALIAQGKSNREIAKAMTVGVKTIETYVTRVLNKLGFDSRVQIATWMIGKGFNEKELQ
jgi:predicted ATPase/DNA-binding CsgD family transcriptional regulator